MSVLTDCIDNNDVQSLQTLIDNNDAHDLLSVGPHALFHCIEHNRYECIEPLLRLFNPREQNDYALRLAAHHGYVECVNILLPLSNPERHYECLVRSLAKPHNPCFDLFLVLVNPADNNSEALAEASYHQNQHAFDVLYPLSDPHQAYHIMSLRHFGNKGMRLLDERIKADQERQILSQQVQDKPSGARSKM